MYIHPDDSHVAAQISQISQFTPLIEGQRQLRFVHQQEGSLRAGKDLLFGKPIYKDHQEPALQVFS